MEATFVERWYDSINNHPVLVYEYRSHKYDVVDYGWKGGEPLSWQHKLAQAHIDEMIEIEKNKSSDFVPEKAEAGFELFWEIYN